uniref:Uncharacterized protein n=1 Tax=Plectus sambesii TaxID=2011161 RepID=A0A914WY85_9BILA
MSNQAEILKKLSFGVKRKSAAAKIKPGSKLSTTTTAPALVETQVLKPIVTETKRRDAVEEESTSAPEIIKGLQVSTERQGKSRKRKRSDDGPVPASKRREMVAIFNY